MIDLLWNTRLHIHQDEQFAADELGDILNRIHAGLFAVYADEPLPVDLRLCRSEPAGEDALIAVIRKGEILTQMAGVTYKDIKLSCLYSWPQTIW